MRLALAVAAVVSIVDTTAVPASIALSQQSGGVADTPVFASATTSTPCPATYGSDVLLRVGRPGGPFTNLAPPASGGGFDRSAVTVQPNRSLATALGTTPDDGEWWVVVECFSVDNGRHPERFVMPITVAGTRWRQGTPPPGGAAPAAGVTPSGAATAGPAAPGSTALPTPPGAAAVGPVATPPARTAPVAGTRSSTWLVVTGGVALALLLAGGAVALVRRRSGSAGSGRTVHVRQRT